MFACDWQLVCGTVLRCNAGKASLLSVHAGPNTAVQHVTGGTA